MRWSAAEHSDTIEEIEVQISEAKMLERTYFAWVYVSCIPAEPITKAGKTRLQYVSGVLANGRRMVATIDMHRPRTMNHFGNITRESGPVKVMASAERLKGNLRDNGQLYSNRGPNGYSLMLDGKNGRPPKDILPICCEVQEQSRPPEVRKQRDKEKYGKIRIKPCFGWPAMP